jgi:transposase-like protein
MGWRQPRFSTIWDAALMLGFKSCKTAQRTLAGIELMYMLKKE